jgi:predicted  nucleic acid-binding Zn-ribbon protein
MYISQNTTQYKHYQDFQKYAQFICEKFDIVVQLESTRAETNGKVIYLPNVMSMTSKELDMMYAILLHEAGHIRYSTFDEAYFKKLKTKAHAFLANSIEDARIENLLMVDFGGAKNMFESLYTDYTQDKVLMKKVFKHDGSKPDLFTALAFYAHNVLIKCETSPLKEICGARMANRIHKFWKENDLVNLVENVPLETDDDVIKLTNLIYDLFVNKFRQKDTSDKVDFIKDLAEKKKIQNTLDNLKVEGQKIEAQVNELNEKVEQLHKEIEDFEQKHEPEIRALDSAQSSVNQQIKSIDEKVKWKKEYDSNAKTVAQVPQQITNLENDIDKKVKEKARLEQMLESGLTGRKKEMTQEQKDATAQKIATKKAQLDKSQQKLKNLENELNQAQKSMEEAEHDARMNQSKFDKNLDLEQMNQKRSELCQELAEITKQMNDFMQQKNELQKQINQVDAQIDQIQANFMEKAASAMFEMDKMVRNNEMDLDIMPELHYEDSWPEAADAQEQFDEQATKSSGKMVRNGQRAAGMFGSNVRDIITFIDKKKEQVEEIDVAEIFKNKIGTSKLEDFNADTKQMNYMEDKSVVGVFGTRRDHIPLTTMFDNIKKENTSNKMQDFKELMATNAHFYRNLKRVFARRFKFAKKDFWKGGQEEGKFDARNLWKLPTNQGDDFYERNKPKFENKVAASILIDLSGSQNKEATEYGKKIRALVLGLSQALDEVHIKHEILGYHAPVCDEMRGMDSSGIYTRRSNRLETIVFKDTAQKDPMGIMNIEPQMTDNSDGESLRIALKRLKAIRAKSHMIFVISDGKPFLCDTDVSVLDEDFRAALRQAVRDKVQVFGMGFFKQLEHFFGERFCDTTKDENVLKFFEQTRFQ